MAEKVTSKKRPPRQQMLDTLVETEKAVAERRAQNATPEEKVEAKVATQAIAAADELSTEGVGKSISDLKSVVGKMLTQLSDRLEEQVARYVQVQRAIVAKDAELREIYEIQRSASTLTALIESQEQQRTRFESELADMRAQLDREVAQTRAEWEREKRQREIESKERDAAEQKRREREKEEYRYAFAREQQQARDQFADESAKAHKELAERERAVESREQELAALRKRVDGVQAETDAAVAKAVGEAVARQQRDAGVREDLLKREFAGERNVLTTRIGLLEQTVKEQAEQLARLQERADKAYGQVQDIAVRAIEGAGTAKQLNSLQQMLADQSRKVGGDR